ncbi:MAG: hypothetical protein ACI837_002171 [Crocinitomicaceae bacterium]
MKIKHISYHRRKKSTPWRKVSIGSWKPRGDSSCYSFEDICVDQANDWCTKNDVALSSFILKAVAASIAQKDQINSVVRFGKVYRRKSIRLFYHVLPSRTEDDLSGALFDEPQTKSVKALEEDFKRQLALIKAKKDNFAKGKKTFRYLPGAMARPSLNFLSFLMYTLNVYPFFVPAERDPFGSVMVTNIGSLGLTKGATPIAPYTRIPMVIAIGKQEQRAVVENDEILKKTMMTFGFTFDHRILDGVHFAEFFDVLKSYFLNPETIE